MNKAIILVIIVIVLIGGIFVLNRPSSTDLTPTTVVEIQPTTDTMIPSETTPAPTETVPVTSSNTILITPAPAMASAVKEFTVTGSNFSFSPNAIKVKKGDKVKITFKNAGGFHDLKIDEFGVATSKIQDGTQETVEFTVDKTGAFEYYCSVESHRQMGMKGTLIVEE